MARGLKVLHDDLSGSDLSPSVDSHGPELLRRALDGDGVATRGLVDLLSPVVHARVARVLMRSGQGRKQGRDLRQDIEDLVQEVFASLLAQRGRLLRAWDPARGMSLPNFFGLLTENQVRSILRSGRRSPWSEEATERDAIELVAGATESPHASVSTREALGKIVERLRAELTPAGIEMFELLVVDELSVEDVCHRMGMTADAVYAWRSRLGKQARKIRDEIAREGAPAGGRVAD
jgi:DNA-directed RNA polymerase specialized sigma24 family protein